LSYCRHLDLQPLSPFSRHRSTVPACEKSLRFRLLLWYYYGPTKQEAAEDDAALVDYRMMID
jgi:hypothetical protein